MPKYGIATLLEDHDAGYDFAPDNPPLHLTHVDSFSVSHDAPALRALLTRALVCQKCFTVRALREELYGPDKDIPVNVVELSPALSALHNLIMDTLDNAGVELNRPHFHRDGFRPHVSTYGNSRRIIPGQHVSIKDISVAAKVSEIEGANHRILFTIPFV